MCPWALVLSCVQQRRRLGLSDHGRLLIILCARSVRLQVGAAEVRAPGRAGGELLRQETRGDAARFAGAAVRELTRTVAILPKPRREADFIVLKAPEVPSVLVEMGFLSDPGDEAALRKPEHRALIAASLARAVEAWLTSSRAIAHG